MKTIIRYIKYLYYKFKYRKSFGPWMRWLLDKRTKEEVLKNGWLE